ncbi:MAG: SGNH/GDSL hydrolase family protein [Candidatus Eiseniibacteriota bacterium]
MIALALLLASLAVQPAGTGTLPQSRDEILFVGDSVTAGVWFLGLSDRTAAEAWPSVVLRRLGLPGESTRLDGTYPLDHLDLTRRGAGLLGTRYTWRALGAILGRSRPLYAEGEPRSIVAVPGQTLGDVLRQSSDHYGPRATGWVFGALFLPRHLTAVETIEQGANRPLWIVLGIGANDLLSPFGIVGGASAPAVESFEADFRELTQRLRAVMPPDEPASQMLLMTLPDVTALPFLQPVGPGAKDAGGEPLPAGTKTSAFLLPLRNDRFEGDEVWTPEELETARALGDGYNAAIREVAAEGGYGIVDLERLSARLGADPAFADPLSPYFSPDLHHPSGRLHAEIAEAVLQAMADAAGVAVPAASPPVDPPADPLPETALPENADFTEQELARVRSFTRIALLGMESGYFPPGATFRGAIEIGAQAGSERAGRWAAALHAGAELGPGPVTSRWVSRLFLQGRTGAFRAGDDAIRWFPADGSDLRLGLAFEPLGAWRWKRVEVGSRYGFSGGFGWYGRAEWRALYAEVLSGGLEPDRFEAGVRLGAPLRRPGHNGN